MRGVHGRAFLAKVMEVARSRPRACGRPSVPAFTSEGAEVMIRRRVLMTDLDRTAGLDVRQAGKRQQARSMGRCIQWVARSPFKAPCCGRWQPGGPLHCGAP